MSASSDGVVTATVDTTTASVLLTIDFTGMLGSAASASSTITVTEQTSGRTVRGLTSAVAPGTIAVGIDHEAAFNTSLSYVAKAVSASFNLTSAAASITLPLPASGYATWIKSLTTPSLSQQVDTAEAPQWATTIEQGVLQVIGSPFPIVVQDARQADTTGLTVLTQTAAAEASLVALLNTPGPYLLQFAGYSEPDRYVMVGAASRQGTATSVDPFRTWQLALTQVAYPDPTGWQVALPGHTYGDSAARWATYSARTGTYESRETT